MKTEIEYYFINGKVRKFADTELVWKTPTRPSRHNTNGRTRTRQVRNSLRQHRANAAINVKEMK